MKDKKTRNERWSERWNDRSLHVFDEISIQYVSGFEMISPYDWSEMVSKFLSLIQHDKVKRVLELGCGSGAFLSAVQNIVPDVSISGCDISSNSIYIASKRLKGTFINENADTEIEVFINRSDLVLAFSVFQYFDDYNMANKVLNNMLSYIKNKGSIFIGDVPDINKKKQDIKQRKIDGRGTSDHLYYNKDFFLSFASSNNLLIEIYDHVNINLPASLPNREFRYSVFMRHKSE